jgi:hypothetical protein
MLRELTYAANPPPQDEFQAAFVAQRSTRDEMTAFGQGAGHCPAAGGATRGGSVQRSRRGANGLRRRHLEWRSLRMQRGRTWSTGKSFIKLEHPRGRQSNIVLQYRRKGSDRHAHKYPRCAPKLALC